MCHAVVVDVQRFLFKLKKVQTFMYKYCRVNANVKVKVQEKKSVMRHLCIKPHTGFVVVSKFYQGIKKPDKLTRANNSKLAVMIQTK